MAQSNFPSHYEAHLKKETVKYKRGKKSSRNNHHSFIISSPVPPLVALTVCKCVCVNEREKNKPED